MTNILPSPTPLEQPRRCAAVPDSCAGCDLYHRCHENSQLKQLPPTTLLMRAPLALPDAASHYYTFEPGALVVLQFLPSGACVPLTLDNPAILGRRHGKITDDVIDLSPYNALLHGVSRCHCLLQRDNNQLIVADLKSINATYLNGQRLTPYEEHAVAHGSRLILGTLHMLVFIRPPAAPPTE